MNDTASVSTLRRNMPAMRSRRHASLLDRAVRSIVDETIHEGLRDSIATVVKQVVAKVQVTMT